MVRSQSQSHGRIRVSGNGASSGATSSVVAQGFASKSFVALQLAATGCWQSMMTRQVGRSKIHGRSFAGLSPDLGGGGVQRWKKPHTGPPGGSGLESRQQQHGSDLAALCSEEQTQSQVLLGGRVRFAWCGSVCFAAKSVFWASGENVKHKGGLAAWSGNMRRLGALDGPCMPLARNTCRSLWRAGELGSNNQVHHGVLKLPLGSNGES